MPAQKILHSGVEKEAQENLPRMAEHHDEGHQRAAGAANLKMAKVSPLCRGPDYAECRRDSGIDRAIWVA